MPSEDGMQQELGYAKTLDIPFVFSSNANDCLLHDINGNILRRSYGKENLHVTFILC